MLGFEDHRQAYLDASVQIGGRVRVVSGNDVFEGVATDVDEGGALCVDTEDGVRVVHAGDVIRVR